MEAVGPSRERAVEQLLDAVRAWARRRADVRAVALVGSRARGAARSDSDVDLVLLTDAPDRYVAGGGWARELGAAGVLRTRRWGPLTERRLALPGGLEADVGIAGTAWAATAPLDPGTARVVADGLVALHDPDGLLAAVVAAAAGGRDR